MGRQMGVTLQSITDLEYTAIQQEMNQNNMDEIWLEKAPKIAVYRPPDDSPYRDPWDDAVRIALEYAEISYDSISDRELISGTFFYRPVRLASSTPRRFHRSVRE